MDPIRASIERPIAVIAAVFMVVMFGIVSLLAIPIQLAPDLNRPVITVNTSWPGAAPVEIEREIVNRQQEVLKGLDGLEEMESTISTGSAEITLEFSITQNMDRALLLVANRLDRVNGYPEEADEPTIEAASAEDSPIAWFVITRVDGNTAEIASFGDFGEDVIQERMERVSGVARTNLFGGAEREMRVEIDPERLARFGLTVGQVVTTLRQANASISAGDVEEGKRRYVVRTEGDFETVRQVEEVVLRSSRDPASGRVSRITVADVGQVSFGYKDPSAVIRVLGEPALAVNAIRETGANVIETMAGLQAAVDDLNRDFLPARGLIMRQVYDETIYINSSIDLVISNIYVGGLLAAIVLMTFLRSWRASLVVALAMPVSVIGTFVAMAALGRSINVVSMAGMAFAIGMVVDAAIVVLENIFRLRQQGVPPAEAAYRGAAQVWGAILVSALTTVMAFIPVLIMELEVGQLFRDIAVAISVSVLLSLVVAVTVIPALSAWLLAGSVGDEDTRVKLPGIDQFGRGFVAGAVGLTRAVTRSRSLALGIVGAVTVAASVATWVLLPKLEYLPEGNRNLVFGIILPPPGYNLATATDIARKVEDAVRPHWSTETGAEPEEGGPPKMKHFFFVAFEARTFLGARAEQPDRVAELIPILRRPVFSEPGTFGIFTQPSIFGRGVGGGRTIDLDVSGPDLPVILGLAQEAFAMVGAVLPAEENNQVRPIPGLELGAPEVRVIPDTVRLADSGLSVRELGAAIDAFNDGLRVAEITVDGQRMDLMLAGPDRSVTETQGIASLPVVTPNGQILPAEALSRVIVTAGPTQIQHKERVRTVTLQIRPRDDLPLEAAMELLETEVLGPLRAEGLPPGVSVRLSGTADRLTETWDAMVIDLLIAIVIVYLVMAVLFESFWYPLIILFSVPLATAGGIGGLALLNLLTYQALDMLTLLGFVILIGIVVNNAILLVDQSLYHLREQGMSPAAAIEEAASNRIRPIFMSTLTSVFGMLPLVVMPGAGSELYRGLGSVVVGGLSLSAVLTLVIIPALLSLAMALVERWPATQPELSTDDGLAIAAE